MKKRWHKTDKTPPFAARVVVTVTRMLTRAEFDALTGNAPPHEEILRRCCELVSPGCQKNGTFSFDNMMVQVEAERRHAWRK